MLCNISADDSFKLLSYFSQKIDFDISCKLSPVGDNLHEMSKTILSFVNLSSAELAHPSESHIYNTTRLLRDII